MSVPAATIAIVLIWASTPLAIKWSGEGAGAMFALASRMALGTVLALVLVWVLRHGIPMHRKARHAYIAGGLGLYLAMTCVYWGAQHLPSGLVSVVFGLNPLITSLILALWLGERSLSPRHLLGLALGILGLAVVFETGMQLGELAWAGILGVLAATTFQAGSAVWVRHISAGVPASSITAGSLLVALPFYLATWWLTDGSWPQDVPFHSSASIVYLALVGSVIGFMLYYYALQHLGAARISLVTLITPVLSLMLGQWLNGETSSLQQWLGTGLILAGLAAHQWPEIQRLYSRINSARTRPVEQATEELRP